MHRPAAAGKDGPRPGGEGVSRKRCLQRARAQVLDPDVRPTKLPSRGIAVSFLRRANLDSELVDRLSRYKPGLWRQPAQTLFALHKLKRR